MSDVIALLGTDYFLVGIRFGLAAVVVGWGLRWLISDEPRPLPIVGLFVVAGTVATIYLVEDAIDPVLIPALVIISVGVGLARILGAPAWAQALSAVPGATWLGIGTEVTELFWVRVLFVVVIPAAGFLINDFELRHDVLGIGVIYFSLAVLGVFGAVPDTEWAVALVAVAFPVTLLAWPRVAGSFGPLGSFIAVAVLVWVTAQGGEPRPASILGGIACLGLLLLEPIVIAIRPGAMRVSRWIRRDWIGAVVASIPQFMVVLICSRVAARFVSPWPALVIVAFAYGAVLAVGIISGAPPDAPEEASA